MLFKRDVIPIKHAIYYKIRALIYFDYLTTAVAEKTEWTS